MNYCRATGRIFHQYDSVTHQCPCGRWERGFAPKKERKLAVAECQCCEGQQAIRDGLIVNHGYKRPGIGFLVGQCFGVGYAPFPATDALERYLTALQNGLASLERRVEEVKVARKLLWTGSKYNGMGSYTDVSKQLFVGDAHCYRGEAIAKNGDTFTVSIPSFDEHQKSVLYGLGGEIRLTNEEIKRVVARIAKGKALQSK